MGATMKIASIGGGPAGLFFSILMKKAFPHVHIEIHERNRPEDTFGWGVVFSDETLDNLEEADPPSLQRIRAAFRYWDDIETFIGDAPPVRSTGHGFCGMSRKELLMILHERCRELGVELHFESEIDSPDAFPGYDLVLGVDGVNSRVRELGADFFKPSIDWRQCRFAWFGTDKPMEAFTFVFQPTEWGLFQVHAYPFQQGRSTWIVECHEDVWRRAGLEGASEADTVAYCTELFADHLAGHELLSIETHPAATAALRKSADSLFISKRFIFPLLMTVRPLVHPGLSVKRLLLFSDS